MRGLVADENDIALRACFAGGVLGSDNIQRLASSYRSSDPYLHVVVEKLFQDDLLSKVKDECIGELSFTEKETDIYKVRMTYPLTHLQRINQSDICDI